MKNINIQVADLEQEQIWSLCKLIQRNITTEVILSEQVVDDSSQECIISNTLKKLGMPTHLLGYLYTIIAVRICIMNEGIVENITKDIYPHIAMQYQTTPSKVEHAMREAIYKSLQSGEITYKKRVFGKKIIHSKTILSNSEYVAMVTDYITLNFKAI
ncbi:MAG: sporulation initiation factor Spo0A C-terminal domain-containing protein [Eubacteriales bacterium]